VIRSPRHSPPRPEGSGSRGPGEAESRVIARNRNAIRPRTNNNRTTPFDNRRLPAARALVPATPRSTQDARQAQHPLILSDDQGYADAGSRGARRCDAARRWAGEKRTALHQRLRDAPVLQPIPRRRADRPLPDAVRPRTQPLSRPGKSSRGLAVTERLLPEYLRAAGYATVGSANGTSARLPRCGRKNVGSRKRSASSAAVTSTRTEGQHGVGLRRPHLPATASRSK